AWLRVALGVSGVALLVTLGGMGIRDSFKMPMALTAPVTETKGGSFRSGLAISMANPMAVGYWLSVGGALVAAGVAGSTPAQTASFVAGFLGGTFAWAFVMALAVRWGKPLLTPVAFRAITFLCGATMLVFGFGLASQMIGNLL
ncbi:MAG: LysE family transporter, partial [Chloroflexi bacterium]|nr:LysE family transporter [Chloroflexota bacterium]